MHRAIQTPRSPHKETGAFLLGQAKVLGEADRRRESEHQRSYLTSMDPWHILNIKKGANARTVKRAYRKRSKETHPDLNPGKNGEEFRLVAWAYKAIINPGKEGPCPVNPDINVKENLKKETKKTEKKKPNLNPDYAKDDQTLRYFDNDLRDHLVYKYNVKAQKRERERPSTVKVKPISLEELLAKEKDSKLGRKWAEKLGKK